MKITDITVKRRSLRERVAKTRIYIHAKGETIWENLENRTQRPYNVYRKEVIPAVLEHLGKQGSKVAWSQFAGCPCPCSPGFIVKEGDWNRDVFVTVE